VESILVRLGVPLDTLDRPMKQLSRGQQQKVAIARSFLTKPALLLMDEPTTGLDPRAKREVQSILRLMREEQTATVLLSTHDMHEAETLCDDVVILEHGRMLARGSPRELRRRYAVDGTEPSLEEVYMRLSGKTLEASETPEESE
jgi:ABC-2 type transport system ATP-binding protein